MTDINGRTISVGDYAESGKIIALDQTNNKVKIQAFNTMPIGMVPAGVWVASNAIVTDTKVWSTCWPSPCEP